MKYTWSIIGHDRELRLLEQDIATDNVVHAYIFVGPEGVGKYTIAKKMAGILQCENNFCHTCPTCIQVEKGSHIDTIELHDDGSSLKIETMRKLVETVNMTTQAKRKVVLIDSIERLTTEAANAFLKTLEEPAVGTVFIMTTNNLRAVLPTMLSRSRVIRFNNVSDVFLKEGLKQLYPEKDSAAIDRATTFAMGKTARAQNLISNPDYLETYYTVYNDVERLLDVKNLFESFAYIEEILANEERLGVFMEILTNVLRTRILAGGEKKEHYINVLETVGRFQPLIKKNVNPRLVLENLMLTI